MVKIYVLFMTKYLPKYLAGSWGPSLSWVQVDLLRSSSQKVRWWDYHVAGESRRLAHNTSGRPGTQRPPSLFVLCWSHAQSHVSVQMGHALDENQTSLWNDPGYDQNQYETTERVNII